MNFKARILKTIAILLFFHTISFAQDCPLPQASKELKGNNIIANILNGGDLFWNRSEAAFNTNSEFPSIDVHSIFNAGLWIGGFTPGQSPNLMLSAATYNSPSSLDYSAGPLDENGLSNIASCFDFDRLWEVFGSEINEHIEDFEDDGIVALKHSNIYGYPANQNPFFEDINGFPLPNQPHGLAPFFDNDSDGIYNPDNGDYPLPESVHFENYPEHLIWGIFNDSGANHTSSGGDHLRMEIQLTAWLFSCSDNDILNNTIFTSHKLIKREWGLDTLYAGMFLDFDLGCKVDDYVGSIPELNTFYSYNSDPIDGNNGATCIGGVNTYANVPPVQSVTFLNHSMSSFGLTSPINDPSVEPDQPAHYYNLLTATWPDGTPFTFGGDGYNSGGTPTSFLFDGNPNTPGSWSMNSAAIPDGDFKAIGAVEIGSLSSGQTFTMDMAYTFHRNQDLNNIEMVNLVYDNIPLLQQMYNEQFEMACTDLYLPTQDFKSSEIQIFPNPVTNLLNIKLDEQPSQLTIFDVYGKRVFEKISGLENEMQISIDQFSAGVYFVKIKIGAQDFVKKIIKL